MHNVRIKIQMSAVKWTENEPISEKIHCNNGYLFDFYCRLHCCRLGVPGIFIHSLDTPNPIYPGTHFDISANCAIEHGGSTGNIVVNDPANGDVQTCGKVGYPGGYDCR